MEQIPYIATIVGASLVVLWLTIYFGWLTLTACRRKQVRRHDRYINEYYLKLDIHPSPAIIRIRNAAVLRYNDMCSISFFNHLSRYKILKIETYDNIGIRHTTPAPKLPKNEINDYYGFTDIHRVVRSNNRPERPIS